MLLPVPAQAGQPQCPLAAGSGSSEAPVQAERCDIPRGMTTPTPHLLLVLLQKTSPSNPAPAAGSPRSSRRDQPPGRLLVSPRR